MSNIFYLYAHPNPASFNAVMKQHALDTLISGKHELILSDLYQNQFNPVASWHDFNVAATSLNTQYFLAQQEAFLHHNLADDIVAELKKVQWADHLIFQFPLWWFSVPAILKGWFDRILVKGFAYDTGKIFNDGLLKGKTASLILTTQSPEAAYQKDGVHGATIDTFLHAIHHTLRFVGITPTAPFVAYNAFNLDKDRQQQVIDSLKEYLSSFERV